MTFKNLTNNMKKLNNPSKILGKFILTIFTILTLFVTMNSCNTKLNKVQSKSTNDSLIEQAELFAQLHNDGVDYVMNYPDQDSLNLYQKVLLSKSFCLINNIDTNSLNFTPEDVQNFYTNYDTDNLTNLVQQLLTNNIIDEATKNYLNQAIDISNEGVSFDQKIAELAQLQINISNDGNINYNSKVISMYSVTTFKESATYWNGYQKTLKNLHKTNNDCDDCLKNNLWKIAGMDAVSAIFGIFFSGPAAPIVSVATAIAVSTTSSCRFCNMCSGCGGPNPWNPYFCNNCPLPSQFDGASCFFGRPTSGSVFIMNGNLYWDDPSHQCKLPIWNGLFTQGTWDGAHCYYPIPSGGQAFVYKNGLYIKCVK